MSMRLSPTPHYHPVVGDLRRAREIETALRGQLAAALESTERLEGDLARQAAAARQSRDELLRDLGGHVAEVNRLERAAAVDKEVITRLGEDCAAYRARIAALEAELKTVRGEVAGLREQNGLYEQVIDEARAVSWQAQQTAGTSAAALAAMEHYPPLAGGGTDAGASSREAA